MKFQAPNPCLPAGRPSTKQAPMTEIQMTKILKSSGLFLNLDIEYLNLFRIWNLLFGI